MISDLLKKARVYEAEAGSQISDAERPVYHVTPTSGWLNDPNGFSYYNGKYHLFYQYYPYATHWDSMHWGHLVSDDMINWERLPASMAPDASYDSFGVFSGSALAREDGKHLLMYTGVEKVERKEGERFPRCPQTQCIAIGNGLNYEKYEHNPVITADMLPGQINFSDFRDPKIWYDKEEACYYCIVANRAPDMSGNALLFSSPDALDWSFVTILAESKHQIGDMWECPDFFPLDDTYLLTVSPINMEAKEYEFYKGNNSIYLVGAYDKESHTFTHGKACPLDYGLDFYAPQTSLTPDGRRIMIGWMQCPMAAFNPNHPLKWLGQLTIPRELTFKDGKLFQNPIKELESYRKNQVIYHNLILDGNMTLPDICGRSLDLTVSLRPENADSFKSFTLSFAEGDGKRTFFSFNPAEKTITIDKSASGYEKTILASRTTLVGTEDGSLKLRLLLDRFSAEIFIGDGEKVMSTVFYTPLSADGLSFSSQGKVIMDLEKYDISR